MLIFPKLARLLLAAAFAIATLNIANINAMDPVPRVLATDFEIYQLLNAVEIVPFLNSGTILPIDLASIITLNAHTVTNIIHEMYDAINWWESEVLGLLLERLLLTYRPNEVCGLLKKCFDMYPKLNFLSDTYAYSVYRAIIHKRKDIVQLLLDAAGNKAYELVRWNLTSNNYPGTCTMLDCAKEQSSNDIVQLLLQIKPDEVRELKL